MRSRWKLQIKTNPSMYFLQTEEMSRCWNEARDINFNSYRNTVSSDFYLFLTTIL